MDDLGGKPTYFWKHPSTEMEMATLHLLRKPHLGGEGHFRHLGAGFWERSVEKLPIAGFTIVCSFGVAKIVNNHPFLGHVSPILWNIHGKNIYKYIYIYIIQQHVDTLEVPVDYFLFVKMLL